MASTSDVINLLKSQVGYHEGRDPDGEWNNYQKYSPNVPGLEWSQNQAWCATFASWIYINAGVQAGSFPITASVGEAMQWYKEHNRWSEYPSIGGQIIFGEDKHTGIVTGFDSTYVYTIEGNTNSNGSANGDGVYARTRVRRDPYVTGYGLPTFTTESNGDLVMAVNNQDARVLWSYKGDGEKFDSYAYLLGTWKNVDQLIKQVADLTAKVDALSAKIK